MKRWLLILGIVVIMGSVVCHREEVGWIAVNSEPQGAAVYLDDSLTNEVTNCVLEDVPVGEHAIKLTLEGYVDWDTLVEVKAESPTTITATMTSESDTTDTTDTIPAGTLLWRYPTGGGNFTPMLTSDGTIIVSFSSSGELHALNPDGTLKWYYSMPDSFVGLIALVIDSDDNMYYRSSSPPYGILCKLDPKRNLEWEFVDFDASGAIQGCDIAPDGTLCCFYTFRVRSITSSGWQVWEYLFAFTTSLGVIGNDGTIYAFSSIETPGLEALNPDGTLKWRCTSVNPTTFMAIGYDGTIYVGTYDGGLHALSAINESGQLKWKYTVEGVILSSPVVGTDGTIYFGTGTTLNENVCLCAVTSDGNLKWRYDEIQVSFSTSAIGSDGTIYIGSRDTYLYAINPDGSLKWKYEAGAPIVSHLTIGSDGAIYFCTGYHLYAVASDSKGLANSSWPKYQHDNQCTGCVGW